MNDVTSLGDARVEKKLLDAATATHDDVTAFLTARVGIMKAAGAPEELVELAQYLALKFDSVCRKGLEGVQFVRKRT